MNLLNKCTTNEREIEEFIMSHSTKNGDISKYSSQYNSILSKINYYKK